MLDSPGKRTCAVREKEITMIDASRREGEA